ncbi:hypothetical protein L1987_78301 [Smallanthus sonchifolius]|uniref:Uncharacterized protein n=1 Tax=Smallanthus sonchifolius TaxID=185202 RepID=A0ACB8ZDC1_9ASTR|nr:hypothetical protein L1987_78301 [Smallanthus sonchifolius]
MVCGIVEGQRRIPNVNDVPTLIFGADVTHPDSSPTTAALVASQGCLRSPTDDSSNMVSNENGGEPEEFVAPANGEEGKINSTYYYTYHNLEKSKEFDVCEEVS